MKKTSKGVYVNISFLTTTVIDKNTKQFGRLQASDVRMQRLRCK